MTVDRPKVTYQDSVKQAVVDDWKGFVRDSLAPLPVICPTCNGVVQVDSHRHLFARKGYADTDAQGVDPALVDRIVRGAAEKLGAEQVWDRVMSETPALNYIWRGDNRVLAQAVSMMKWDDSKLDHLARIIGRDILPRTDQIALYTYCPNCEDYIEADLPDFMRNDAKHELMRRVAAVHRIEYSWQKPEEILPKAEPPPLPPALSAGEWEQIEKAARPIDWPRALLPPVLLLFVLSLLWMLAAAITG